MSEWVCKLNQKDAHNVYKIRSIVAHIGSTWGGHYTAFCKSLTENKWTMYDDDVFTEIQDSTLHKVQQSSYLIVYDTT